MELSPEQKADYDERMKRAGAFESLVTTEGWKYIVSYYENKIKSFTTAIISKKPIQDFEPERDQLFGLRTVFGQVSSDLEFLRQERNKHEEKTYE